MDDLDYLKQISQFIGGALVATGISDQETANLIAGVVISVGALLVALAKKRK